MSDLDDFFGHQFAGNVPWMASVENDLLVSMQVNLKALKIITSAVPFGETGEIDEVEIQMRDVCVGDDEIVEDGVYCVPFWACSPLQTVLMEVKDDAKKGWVAIGYKRTSIEEAGYDTDGNKKIKTINTAHFYKPE